MGEGRRWLKQGGGQGGGVGEGRRWLSERSALEALVAAAYVGQDRLQATPTHPPTHARIHGPTHASTQASTHTHARTHARTHLHTHTHPPTHPPTHTHTACVDKAVAAASAGGGCLASE